MPQSDPSRTEKATPKQVRKARDKGSVPKGAEMGKTMVLLAGLFALNLLMGLISKHLRDIYMVSIKRSTELQLNEETLYSLFLWCMGKIAILTLPLMLVLAATAYVVLRWQVGSLWTLKVFEPKFGKMFNVMAGLKKLVVDPQTLIRMGKSLLQAAAVGIAPYIVIKQEMPNLPPLFYQNADALAAFLLTIGYKMVYYALLPMLIIAIADLVYTRWDYNEQMKMTKEEVKDERKQAEGDPQIKQQQKSRMMKFMAQRMMQEVPKADVVITNPVHLAIAIRYNPMYAPAPQVLAKGADAVAERIKQVARENDIPIKEDRPLAQALYKQVEIGDIIPEELYQAVAAILAGLDKFKGRYKRQKASRPCRTPRQPHSTGVKIMAKNFAQTAASKIDYQKFAKQGDIMLAGGVVVILFVMLIPLPTLFLDFMLSVSISTSLVVLMTTMFMSSPMEFSIFPSLLLITTLLRLALNVATTRAILLHGDEGTDAAGAVIQSFGEFVVGGNYIIGLVIFMILFILNKIVITQGTTRIAEVAARFTLDAMPGKQMAIEADLNSGLINEEEARQQRESIRKEADFYGAMDGAGKFVQGDVKAGLIITFINIIGGILIGVLEKNMDWVDAAHTYTLLTIGDGLVATIPSIIISTSAGIIVSRAAAEAKMGEEFLGQLTFHPRALRLVSVILVIFAIVPGMPTIPFLLLAGLIYLISQVAQKHRSAIDASMQAPKKDKAPSVDTPEEVQSLLPLDQLELEVGYGLIPLVDEDQDGNLLARIRSIRRQFALDMGVVVPSLHLRDNLELKPGEYRLLIKGNSVAGAEILIDHYLAMDPGDAKHRIRGVETVEPAFNLPALWIPGAQKEEAMLAGYTVVDPSTVIATHITEVFRRHLHEFLGRQEVQTLLDNLKNRAPQAVENVVPTIVTLGTVQKVLQNLVSEGVSVRDILTIMETLADYGQAIHDPTQLTEYVRSRLGRTIIRPYLGGSNNLAIISLSPSMESRIAENVRQSESGAYLAMSPEMAQKIIRAINKTAEKAIAADGQPVLLTNPQIRSHLSQLVTRFIPTLPVISQAEIPPDIRIQSIGTVEA